MQNTSKKCERTDKVLASRDCSFTSKSLGQGQNVRLLFEHIFHWDDSKSLFMSSFQLELPQDKFFPPEGWKFEGGWQKKPELRYKNNGINVSLTLLNN